MRLDVQRIGELKTPTEVQALKDILSRLADELDVLYETTDPNGNITTRRGKLCIYYNGSTYVLKMNLDGNSLWQAV